MRSLLSISLSCGRALRELEMDLLGWELPPIDIAMSEFPIRPDAVGTWCFRCGESIGIGEQTDRGCASCRGCATPLVGVVRLGEYCPPLSTRILQLKYMRWPAMARTLGIRLAQQVRASLPLDRFPQAVVAMPMPWIRSWWRGIDHAAVIASGVASELDIPLVSPLSQRLGPTQASRSRTDRQRSSKRFHPRRRGSVSLQDVGRVLLVDDVRTTGASLRQAAICLRAAGATEVIGAVLAVVPSPRRSRVQKVPQKWR